ncbi:MAG: acylphosphatase [Anaerolineales bacterium]
MNEKTNRRLHARVIGRVQGVGFRYFVIGVAGELGLTGWVRNRQDGSVELVAEGDEELLNKLIQALKRGSRSSLVSAVQEEWLDSTGEFHGFSARSTI